LILQAIFASTGDPPISLVPGCIGIFRRGEALQQPNIGRRESVSLGTFYNEPFVPGVGQQGIIDAIRIRHIHEYIVLVAAVVHDNGLNLTVAAPDAFGIVEGAFLPRTDFENNSPDNVSIPPGVYNVTFARIVNDAAFVEMERVSFPASSRALELPMQPAVADGRYIGWNRMQNRAFCLPNRRVASKRVWAKYIPGPVRQLKEKVCAEKPCPRLTAFLCPS
jgi:hypothetical protein